MKIEYLSASRLNTWIDCPFKYFLQYHLALPELRKNTIHTRKGNAVHEALDMYAKGDKDFETQLKKYYAKTKLWELDNRSPRRGFPHPVEKDCDECPYAIYSAKGTICSVANRNVKEFDGCPRPNFDDDLKLTRATIFKENSVFNRKLIGSEVEFDKEYEGFKVRGFIDLITEIDDETMEVRDYKTGTYTKKTKDAFKDLQMRIYSLVAKELFPKYKYVLMTLDYLRKGPVTVIFGPEDDEKTRAFLQECYTKITESKDPPRKKSFKCSWCIGYEACGKVKESFCNSDGKFEMPEAPPRDENGFGILPRPLPLL